MQALDIEAKLTDRVQRMFRSFVLGDQIESALEMLPASTCASDGDAGSAPAFTTQALIGSRSRILETVADGFAYDGGFDGGTTVNYFGRWIDPKIFDLFDTWRDSAKLRESGGSLYFVNYKGVRFNFLSHGARGSVNFKYMLKFKGFTVLFFGKPVSGECPSVCVDFSYDCFRDGRSLFDVRHEVEDFLLSLGFRWDRVSFQRVDFNVTVNLPFSEVADAFNEGRFVSKVRNWDQRFSNRSDGCRSTYIDGGQNIEICLYDKYHELIKRFNEDKYNDLEHVLGSGRDLTRVEFRLKSAYFNPLDIRSFEDLEIQFPAIVEYLTTAWFRILESKKKRGRENKQEISKFWKCVQFAFKSIFIKANDIKPLVKKRKYRFSQSRLLRQAIGCLNKALSMSYRPAKELDLYLSDVFFMLNNYKRLAFKQYQEKVEEVNVLYRRIRVDLPGRSERMGRVLEACLPGI